MGETVAVESESVEDVPVTEDADEVEEVAAKTEEVAVKAEYDEYVCYDDDACLGKAAPALDSLEVVQGDEKCLTYTDKPTVILFWAKFLKWQVHSALVGCEKLWKTGTVNVVGIATDPKKSAVERHISKGECPTTCGIAWRCREELVQRGVRWRHEDPVCDSCQHRGQDCLETGLLQWQTIHEHELRGSSGRLGQWKGTHD